MLNLTEREVQILTAIENFIKDKGYSPSVRDIGGIVHLSSSSNIHRYLEKLKKKGYIDWKPTQSRTIQILKAAV